MESLDLASSDQLALGACLNEANTPLEEGVPVASPPNVEEVGMGAPLGVVSAPTPPPMSIGAGPSKKRLPDQVLVSTYVLPLERVHPSMDMVVPDLEDVLKIVHCWNPLNQEEFSVTHIRNLYPNYFQIPVAARSKQYSIMLPIYMDKETFQPVTDDWMLIRNHNFHRLVELVSVDF